jgi:hypothetical protein
MKEAKVSELKTLSSLFNMSVDDIIDYDENNAPKEVVLEEKGENEQFNLINQLDEEDKSTIFKIIDTMLTKKKFKERRYRTKKPPEGGLFVFAIPTRHSRAGAARVANSRQRGFFWRCFWFFVLLSKSRRTRMWRQNKKRGENGGEACGGKVLHCFLWVLITFLSTPCFLLIYSFDTAKKGQMKKQ